MSRATCDVLGCDLTARYSLRPTDDTSPADRLMLLCDLHAMPYVSLPRVVMGR